MTTKSIEAIYPLSPLQQGMLFHTLYSPGSGVYLQQLACRLQGNFHVAAFKQAWQQVTDRHSILRTAFVWEGLKEPLQVVGRKVTLSFELEDWRGMPADEQQYRSGCHCFNSTNLPTSSSGVFITCCSMGGRSLWSSKRRSPSMKRSANTGTYNFSRAFPTAISSRGYSSETWRQPSHIGGIYSRDSLNLRR